MKRIGLVVVRALRHHALRDLGPHLALEVCFDLLLGFDQLCVVFFFDDYEVGLETAGKTLDG